jgi:glycosyltransferase involved in cell wall biosynthesis
MRRTVLLIIPNLGYGGAQRVFNDLANVLSKDFDVIECAFNVDGASYYRTTNKIVYLDVPGGANFFSKAFYFVRRIQRLRRIKKSLNVHVTISHLEGADYINLLTSTEDKKICCVHGSKIFDRNIHGALGMLRKKILIPAIYAVADKIVAVSDGVANEFITEFGIARSKVGIINNGFDLREIQSRAEQLVGKAEWIFSKPVLITHGRLAREKNHQLLIHLVALPRLRGKTRVVIIGDGPLHDELYTLAVSMGLNTWTAKRDDVAMGDADVCFLGFQSNPFPFLRRASLYVFPSLNEGFPMALVEAMACGLPVVSSNCPHGPSEILNGGDGQATVSFGQFGVLVENDLNTSDKHLAWASVIERFLHEDDFRSDYAHRAVTRANVYGMEVFKKKWISVINSISRESQA